MTEAASHQWRIEPSCWMIGVAWSRWKKFHLWRQITERRKEDVEQVNEVAVHAVGHEPDKGWVKNRDSVFLYLVTPSKRSARQSTTHRENSHVAITILSDFSPIFAPSSNSPS
jgi:hypothetical protein